MGIHDGHRERRRNLFKEHGLEPFNDHELLEFLLFYAVPRRDTNVIAHELYDRFDKNLSHIFDASIEELMTVYGVGENAALLIKFVPQIAKRYLISKTGVNKILDTTEKRGSFMMPRFYGERDELVYMVCLDSKCQLINEKPIFRGSVNSVDISIRKITETALNSNATKIILAHNHLSGIALPSSADIITTKRIYDVMRAVNVQLVDHIIVTDEDFVSMADSGFMNF